MFLGYLIFTFPVVAVISLLCYLPVYLYGRKRGRKLPLIRHLTVYASIGVVWSILFLTIFWGGFPGQFPVEYHFLNLIPFIWVKETYAMGFQKMIRQLLLNIAMFVPLGLFWSAVFPSLSRWERVMCSVLLFALCIETVQYFIGRSADVDDLIMNTVGGVIGYGIFMLLDLGFHKKTWWENAIDRQ